MRRVAPERIASIHHPSRAGVLAMLAVIFEVWPSEDGRGPYLDVAAELKPLLADIDGFISVERFQSLTEPGKMLSLSFWRDEAALEAWRKTAAHRIAQAKGRGGLFADYRLRVAAVVRDYGKTERAEAPADSRAVHEGPGGRGATRE
jgi:heme-degrading monooxygenase HmoA